MSPGEKKVLYGLLHALCEDQISDQQFAKLDNLLYSSREACEIYVDFRSLWSDLRYFQASLYAHDQKKQKAFQNAVEGTGTFTDSAIWEALSRAEKESPAVAIVKEKAQPELIQKVVHPRRQKYQMTLLHKITLAACAAVVLLFVYLHFGPREGQRVVARVSQSVDAKWLSASGQITLGSDLYAGPLTLKKGYAEILLDSGVRLLLEAPLDLDLETASSIYLRKGRVVANIAQSSEQRFVVRTANSTVVDYGTEFGVEVDDTGQTYTHVFKGKVELRQGSDPLKFENKLPLEAGQSGTANHSGELLKVAPKRGQFITEMPTLYELAVRKTQPLYYWRFGRDQDGSLRSEPDSGLDNTYNLAGKTNYTDGPDLGGRQPNVALRLTGAEDYAILRDCTAEADNADSFTIAMWVRPEAHETTPRYKVITRVRKNERLGDGHRSTILFDYINKQFVFYVGHTSENSEGFENLFDTGVTSGVVQLDAWHHVVVSYTNSDKMNLYVNGQLKASKLLPAEVRLLDFADPAGPYRWLVGFGPAVPSGDLLEDASFAGSVDEISHYKRELSADEVRMLYEAARNRN